MSTELYHHQQQVELVATTADGDIIKRQVPASSLTKVSFYSNYLNYSDFITDSNTSTATMSKETDATSTTTTTDDQKLISAPFPADYVEELDDYVIYLRSKSKMSSQKLIHALSLAHMLEDHDYLNFLVRKVLLADWLHYSSVLQELVKDLQLEVYYRIPYRLIPFELAKQFSFFEHWYESEHWRQSFEVTYNYEPSLTKRYSYKCSIRNPRRRSVGCVDEDDDSVIAPTFTCKWYDDPQYNNPLKYKLERPYDKPDNRYKDTKETYWYKSGQLRKEVIRDKMGWTSMRWHKSGRRYEKKVFPDTDDRLVQRWFNDADNKLAYEIVISFAGYACGVYKRWDRKGRILSEGRCYEGKKDGLWLEITKDGNLVYNTYDKGRLRRSTSSSYDPTAVVINNNVNDFRTSIYEDGRSGCVSSDSGVSSHSDDSSDNDNDKDDSDNWN